MNLAEVMLEVARLTMPTYDGIVTSGSTTYLVDSSMTEKAGTFTGGTCFVTSGSLINTVIPVKTHGENKLTFVSANSTAIQAGDTFSVSPDMFDASLLRQAVKATLATMRVPKRDTTLTAVDGEITLPAGVSDVRQVFIDDKRNQYWSEIAGKLVFDDGADGSAEMIYLAAPTAPATDSADIDPAVDTNLLIWSSVVYLWRNLLQKVRKDNPTATDMLNEAKVNEQQARALTPKKLQRDTKMNYVKGS